MSELDDRVLSAVESLSIAGFHNDKWKLIMFGSVPGEPSEKYHLVGIHDKEGQCVITFYLSDRVRLRHIQQLLFYNIGELLVGDRDDSNR